MEKEIKFTQEELDAMRHMLSTFAKMQKERDIDPEDYDTSFGMTFNGAMCALMDLMWLTTEGAKIIDECGY